MIKRIIFDLDNTLIDFPKDYAKEYDKVIKKYNLNITSLDLYRIIGVYESDDKNIYYDKEKMLDLVNKEFTLNLKLDFIDYLLEIISEITDNVDSGIIDTLEYLSKKYDLVVLTNWFTECQKERLKKANMLKYFKDVYGTDIIPMKPRKESFMSVIGNLKPEECVMVGDNLKVDIEVPYELGFNVYHLNKIGISKYPAIKKIEDLKEML